MTDTDQFDAVPERPAIEPSRFRAEVLDQGQPVVLRGQFSDWPICAAAKAGTPDAIRYLQGLDAGREVETIYGPPEIEGRFFYNADLSGLNFEKRPARISQALGEIAANADIEGSRSVYIQSVPTGENLPAFEHQNPMPLIERVPPRIWVGGRLRVQTHFDLSDNLAVAAAGRREFVLFPPDELPNLYPGPFEHTLAGPPVSMVDLESPDFEAYPRFRQALERAQRTVLEPGDALYIPYFWWHNVRSLETFNVLINYWWNEAEPNRGSPYDALLHAILAVRDLPERQRSIWKHVFDYYAFKSHGDPVAHLPPRARGALGEHNEEMRLRIWAMLTNAVGMQTARLRQLFGRSGPNPRR